MAVIILFLAIFMTGCGNNTPSNNQATRYTDGLHQDAQGAEAAAEKANKKISEFNQTTQQVNESN